MNKEEKGFHRNEVGSEFWNVPVKNNKNNLFSESTQWFLSGRSALTAIIRAIKRVRTVHTVAIPSWCCESIIVPFLRENLEVEFYPVYVKNGKLVQEVDQTKDILFLMDYFGFTSNVTVDHQCIIRDITHSFLSHDYTDAQYCFGSLRKWVGVKSGGFARGGVLENGLDDKKFIDLRTYAMHEKEKYINGKINSKAYLKIYKEAEEYLDKLVGVYKPLKEDIDATQHLDIEFIWTQRRNNAAVLIERLKPYLIFSEFEITDCPMFVPILVPEGKRNALRHYLIQNDIFCPVHWPTSRNHKLDERELHLYNNELSIVCDQRYQKQDMYRIVETIEQFWKEGVTCAFGLYS